MFCFLRERTWTWVGKKVERGFRGDINVYCMKKFKPKRNVCFVNYSPINLLEIECPYFGKVKKKN